MSLSKNQGLGANYFIVGSRSSFKTGAYQMITKSVDHISLEIAAQFCESEKNELLCNATSIDEAAAKSLSRFRGSSLNLNGLTGISDSASDSLSQFQGNRLSLIGLIELSGAAAQSLSKFQGTVLYRNG